MEIKGIKNIRMAKNLTQEECYKELDVSSTTYRGYEAEDGLDKISCAMAFKLAEFLGCDIKDFK